MLRGNLLLPKCRLVFDTATITMAVVVFLVNFVLDIVWAKYTINIQARNPHWAGLWAVGIIAFSGSSVLLYVSQPWLLVPAALGAYVGTVWTVQMEEIK